MDPNFYRKYECNIECYKLKADKCFRCDKCLLGTVEAESATVGSLAYASGIKTYSGSFDVLSTTHTLTPTILPVLGRQSCAGEITFYLNNTLYIGVSMAAIVKSGGAILQTLLYQRVGNFVSVVLSFSGNDVILTVSPAATCRWVYRGI